MGLFSPQRFFLPIYREAHSLDVYHGKSANSCCRCPFMSLFGETISTNHLMMQISKNVLLGETDGLIHGRGSFLAIMGVIGFSLFHTLA